MQIKEIRPINFLYFRTRSKVGELGRFVGIIARELHRDAALNDQEVTGPVYWNYFGFYGDPSKDFALEIAVPIGEIPLAYGGKFDIKRVETFHCISLTHEGSWYDIPFSYRKLSEFALERDLIPTGNNRELYVNVDFGNPEANVTEIQLGIAKGCYDRADGISYVADNQFAGEPIGL